MCSIDTSCSSKSSLGVAEKAIMNPNNNSRRCTLSDNITFRHRHRRYSGEGDDLHCGRITRSKLKCCGQHRNLSLKNREKIEETLFTKHQTNSNSLMSGKNSRFVILAVALLLSIMVTSSTAFNVDVGSKVVHNAPTRTCYDDCMFGFSVAQHKEKGQSW